MTDFELRFYSKVHINLFNMEGCHVWIGASSGGGYGQYRLKGKQYLAHRFAYTNFYKIEISPNMEVDHICRLRNCVNPAHLRLLTSRENTLCGNTITAKNAIKTHCKHGHAFTPENTYITKDGRMCKTCQINNSRRNKMFKRLENKWKHKK